MFSRTKIWQDMRKTMYIDTKRWDLSVLPLETDLYPNFARLGKSCLTLGWDNIFAPSFSAKYIMTSRRYQ